MAVVYDGTLKRIRERLDALEANVGDGIVVEVASQAEQDAAIAAGAKIVVRSDLLSGTTTTSAAPTTSTTVAPTTTTTAAPTTTTTSTTTSAGPTTTSTTTTAGPTTTTTTAAPTTTTTTTTAAPTTTTTTAAPTTTTTTTTAAPGSGITYVGEGALVSGTYDQVVAFAMPAGIQSGDLLLLFTGVWDGGAGIGGAGPVAGQGWTALPLSNPSMNGGYGLQGLGCWYKRAGSSEPSVNVDIGTWDPEWETSGACYGTGRVVAFRGVYATGSPLAVTQAIGASGQNTTTVTGPAQTTSYDNAMMVMFGGAYETARVFSTPSGSVDTIVSAQGFFVAYDNAPSNSAGAQAAPVVAVDTGNAAGWGVRTLALRPA